MKLTLAEPAYFKDSIMVISDLVSEARFKIGTDGLELVAMDPANVAMVIYKLFASSFVDYNVENETEIAINLNNLKQILRRVKPNDMLTLEVSAENKLNVTIKSGQTRTFSLPILELEQREQKVPELDFPVIITTSCSILNDSIEDASIVAESVLLQAEKDKLLIKAEGDLSKASIEIPADDQTSIVQDKDQVKSKYSIEYLKKIITGSKLADTATIYFNEDYPLKIEYKVVDKVLLAFILAPRVDND